MNPPKNFVIDHIDHNPLNNQKSNLRICSRAQNCMNQLPQKIQKSSKYKGVCWDKQMNKWIMFNVTLYEFDRLYPFQK